MSRIKVILFYLRHISFIAFLISMIIMYPSFHNYNLGIVCLITSFIYIIISFITIFIKSSSEENSIFNNFVLCFLHMYICFVAYKYHLVGNYATDINNEYFSFNFLMISICMFVLSINKLIITSKK